VGDTVLPSIRELAVLQQATQLILARMDVETVLHQILLIVRNYFSASQSAVFLVDPASNTLYCQAQNGYDPAAFRRRLAIDKNSIPGFAAFTRAPFYVPNFESVPHLRVLDDDVQSELALPFLVRERVIGVLDVASPKTDAFPGSVSSLLSVFASQAAVAIENSRLHSTELRRMRQIELLNLIARSAAAASDTQQFFTTLAELISDTLENTAVAIVLTRAAGSLHVPAYAGGPQPQIDRLTASRREGVIAEALKKRATCVVEDLLSRRDWPAVFPQMGSEMCIPLISMGEIMGAVVVANATPGYFTAENRSLAQAAADVSATAARNLELSEELTRVANLDSLTTLYNQRYFHHAIAKEIPRAQRHRKEFGLVALDLQRFRDVNAELGLERGDGVLRAVAEELVSELRSNDVSCRYVGDRFCVLLPEVNAQGVAAVCAKLREKLDNVHVELKDGRRSLSAAWASAQFPADGSKEAELVTVLFARLDNAKHQTSAAGA
jgi:sigma-B regulation protein RsbU (phosphoserine phosphatase)